MQFEKLSISEQLLFSTVRIVCRLNNGETSTGTGFFFEFLEEQCQAIPAIVTNKHVVKGAITGRLDLGIYDEHGKPQIGISLPLELDNFEKRWLPHPENDVDLCVMPIGPIEHLAEQHKIKLARKPFNRDILPTAKQLEELMAIEDIVIVGYPIGISDTFHNLPLIRKGITATHPNIDYGGRKEFIIDAACFPGSSGSPVLIYNPTNYLSREGMKLGQRILILGILYASPQYTVKGNLEIAKIPTKLEPVPISHIPCNLGFVIKTEKMLEFNDILKPIVGKPPS